MSGRSHLCWDFGFSTCPADPRANCASPQSRNRERLMKFLNTLNSHFPFGYSSRHDAGGNKMTPPNAVPSDAEFFKQRGFGQKLGFGQRPALLVVDMAKAFTDPGMPLGSNLDKQIEALQQLLRAAHDREAPVIFSTVSYDDENLRDAGIFGMKQKGSASLRAGTAGVQIDSRLDFRKTDSLLVKKY